ncbi:ester cyclase [Peristeroidobacter soli]|jgi:predicted ester cyclase|uniref:ester cyclase n=1 Tax=Peristeroidobacter soli TaxID=2497877 RepID=UPI00101D4D95|nr:ester cyclase [Peristeroidobacter soli]
MKQSVDVLFDSLASAWNSQNLDALCALFTPDCTYIDLAFNVTSRGHAGLRDFARHVYATLPNFYLQFPVRFGSGNQAASEWIITGTWRGDFEGADCTGRATRFTGLSRYELVDDKIRLNLDCWDFLALAKVLRPGAKVAFEPM